MVCGWAAGGSASTGPLAGSWPRASPPRPEPVGRRILGCGAHARRPMELPVPRLIDISPPITERIGVWPGDTPFRQEHLLRLDQGANLDLSAVHTTVHLGAHADGPSHYGLGAPGIGERPLLPYYGPCQVIAVEVGRGQRITPAHLPGPVLAPRVLFRTGTFPDPDNWNDDFAALSPQLVDRLADEGVTLVGLDTPSIDPFHSKALESHQAVLRRDLSVLEGLVLDHVSPGVYTLVALPLRLIGADASPVRAVLVAED